MIWSGVVVVAAAALIVVIVVVVDVVSLSMQCLRCSVVLLPSAVVLRRRLT